MFPPIAQLHPSLHKLHTTHIPLIALTRGQCLKSQLWKLFVVANLHITYSVDESKLENISHFFYQMIVDSKTSIRCYSNDLRIEKKTWITDL